MSNELLIQLDNISQSYTKGKNLIKIFEHLNMEIHKGEFLALMGPSGSGKTTLLNLIGAIDKPTSGKILYDGQRIDHLSESKLSKWRAHHIGFIFQFYNLMPILTAEKNIELPLLLTDLSAKQRREHVQTALSIVGLTERGKHLPKELSGGQQQRVAIARAIVSDPELLLCDEPTGDLDRKTAGEILDILRELNQKFNKTIVMVTHDPEAANYANKLIHLNKGEFIEEALAV